MHLIDKDEVIKTLRNSCTHRCTECGHVAIMIYNLEQLPVIKQFDVDKVMSEIKKQVKKAKKLECLNIKAGLELAKQIILEEVNNGLNI